MQRVHIKQDANFLGGAEYVLTKHLRELYLDFEGLEVVVADPLNDGEESEYTRNPYRSEKDDTLFIPFDNVRAYDLSSDEFSGDTIGKDSSIAFRESLQMFGGATEIQADEIIDRPPGIKLVKGDVEVVVPQNNIAMMEVEEDAL